ALAGYVGGRIDALMMRTVDVLYGLPSILLVVLVDLALRPTVRAAAGAVLSERASASIAELVTLLVAIGGVSWLTMARVIRGQVLSLRAQPFVEAARAAGTGPWRILRVHLLPNLMGPIIVYTTLTVPAAILQESFLSFLGIGVQRPLPSWGNLAADGVERLPALAAGAPFHGWLLLFPCLLLGLTLMALNFLGDALRRRLDPRRARA
ncbi:MAG TPA: ABC transporter permease, partial [Phycisphaeraceae bacterium]